MLIPNHKKDQNSRQAIIDQSPFCQTSTNSLKRFFMNELIVIIVKRLSRRFLSIFGSPSCVLLSTSAILLSNFRHLADAFLRRMRSIHILAHLQYSPQISKTIFGPRSIFISFYLYGMIFFFGILTLIKWDSISLFWIFDFNKMGLYLSFLNIFLILLRRGFYLFYSFVGGSNFVYPKIIAFQSSGCS